MKLQIFLFALDMYTLVYGHYLNQVSCESLLILEIQILEGVQASPNCPESPHHQHVLPLTITFAVFLAVFAISGHGE